MALSYNEVGAVSPGGNISVTFPFLDRSHVTVTVDDITTDKWSWVNNGLIEATNGFPSGTTTRVLRTTPLNSLPASLQGASVLDWEGINRNDLQALFILQEYLDKEGIRNDAIEVLRGLINAVRTDLDGLSEEVLPALDLKAPIDSPAFTGEPTAPTPDIDEDGDRVATLRNLWEALSFIGDLAVPIKEYPFDVSEGESYVTIPGGYDMVSYVLLEGVQISGWQAPGDGVVSFPTITSEDTGGFPSVGLVVGVGFNNALTFDLLDGGQVQ